MMKIAQGHISVQIPFILRRMTVPHFAKMINQFIMQIRVCLIYLQ